MIGVQRSDSLQDLPQRSLGRTLLAVSIAGAALLEAGSASAQAGYFYLDRAQLSGAPDDGFMVFRPYIPDGSRFYGTAALGYSHNPLRSDNVTKNPVVEDAIDNPVEGQLTMYALAGFQLTGRIGMSVSMPILLANLNGRDPQGRGVGVGGMGDTSVALHDLRLDLRINAFETDDGGMRLGGGGAVWVATGDSAAFASDEQVSGWVYGSAEFDLGDFFLAGHIGPHFRPENSIGGASGDLYVGSELRWAFGAYAPIRDGRLRLGGELFGSTGLLSSTGREQTNTVFSGRNTSLEWMAQARYWVDPEEKLYVNAGFGTRLAVGYGSPDFRALVSIGRHFSLVDAEPISPPPKVAIVPQARHYDLDTDGDGYPDSIDKCPTIPEDGKPPDPTDGCPGTSDRDGDGIPDKDDICPDVPEDKDGIQDEDGCPEDDVDNDGIPDQEDRCPLEPGPRSAIPEQHGCPVLTRVREDGEVELLKPIEFEFAKAEILPVSYPILDEVVTLMNARPEIRIGVYGHTDIRGGLPLNMRLSRDRARACMDYLVNKGIPIERLESEGFGPNRPVADNTTDEGRARNRRVEFKILDQTKAP